MRLYEENHGAYECILVLSGYPSAVVSGTWSPEADKFAAGTSGGVVYVWHAAKGTFLEVMRHQVDCDPRDLDGKVRTVCIEDAPPL